MSWVIILVAILIDIVLPVLIPPINIWKKILIGFKSVLIGFQNAILKNKISTSFPFVNITKPHFKFVNKFPWIIKQSKPLKCKSGLVGVICTNIKSISRIPSTSSIKSIHFIDTSVSYEQRTMDVNDDKVKKQINIIQSYYDKLEAELKDAKRYDNKLFQYEGQSVISILKNIYNEKKIKESIENVKNGAKENGAIHFIGDKIGISGYEIVKRELKIKAYETDHFTWLVFKDIFKNNSNKPFFKELICRLNVANFSDREYLVNCLAFLFSSFGIDIVIDAFDCSNKHKILIAARNGEIESNHKSTLHVPINESLSNTDYDNDMSYLDLYHCVQRGIQEEIGIDAEEVKKEFIHFHDFAVVTDEGEIGLGCYVDLKQVMPVEQIKLYPGQDKFLELAELISLPYPPLLSNPYNYPNWFYKKSDNERLCLQWQSFTPLLYHRVIIRNREAGLLGSIIVNTLILTVIVYLFSLISYEGNYIYTLSNNYGIPIPAPIIPFALLTFVELIKRFILNKRFKYSFIKPFIPQWDGDVKVVQATGKHPISKREVNFGSKLSFGIQPEELKQKSKLKLSELRLLSPPYCAVRKEQEGGKHLETPISFYNTSFTSSYHNGQVNFLEIPYKEEPYKSSIVLKVSIQSQRVESFFFTQKMQEDIELDFNKEYDYRQAVAYSNYYKVDKEVLLKAKYAILPDHFVNDWQVYDLFSNRGNYYWSVLSCNSSDIATDMDYSVTKSKHIKSKYFYNTMILPLLEKKENKVYTIRISGVKQKVVDFINNFSSHKDNRRKMSDLDLYIMQLFLIRENFVFAETKYKRIRFLKKGIE